MTKIYVVYHKPSEEYLSSEILQPIQVGSIGKESFDDHQGGTILRDDAGDNISSKNPYFCELTATYWIWKNSKADIVGLMHYRRVFDLYNKSHYFNNLQKNLFSKVLTNESIKEYGWSAESYKVISQLLDKHDIIVRERKVTYNKAGLVPLSIYKQYAQFHIKSDLDKTIDIIHNLYPEFKVEEILMQQKYLNGFNMLICKKEIFDKYCEFIFNVLFDLEKEITLEVKDRSIYHRRAYGFLSERLMSVFLENYDLKVKELSYVFGDGK